MGKTDLAVFFDGELAGVHMKERILSCNEVSEKYGLSLNREQAAALVQVCGETLKKTGRIEMGDGIADRIILEFCDSSYISAENYEDLLGKFIELFYRFKNETHDIISDADLIRLMKSEFDGFCAGSEDLLSQRLTELAKHINDGKTFESFYCGGGR